jgi:hypothetical protein
MQACPETEIPASGSNADLLDAAISLRLDLAACNRRLTRLREWAEVQAQAGQ